MAKPTTVRLLSELINRGDICPTGKLGVHQLVLEIPEATQHVVITLDAAMLKFINVLLEREVANVPNKPCNK